MQLPRRILVLLALLLVALVLSQVLVGMRGESRSVVVRLEDLPLIVIAFSWFAKTANKKEPGLVAKTPLNLWIVLYIAVTLLATLVGYLTCTVRTAAGFFYVLKYVEYFVVYYLTVNNLRDRPQAWRLVTTAFVTAAVVSLIGAARIPSGERVSAPFAGEVGEPNTMGGLVETGIVGLGVFLALLAALLRAGMSAYRGLQEPEDRALALGFVAGTVGLLAHAAGANSFIMVRIMEPYWFFAAVVIALPALERGAQRVAVLPARAVGHPA